VGASGSHWPPESLSLMAAMENCERARERERGKTKSSDKFEQGAGGVWGRSVNVWLTMVGGAADGAAGGSPATRAPAAGSGS
jgi:hypothetical protein